MEQSDTCGQEGGPDSQPVMLRKLYELDMVVARIRATIERRRQAH